MLQNLNFCWNMIFEKMKVLFTDVDNIFLSSPPRDHSV